MGESIYVIFFGALSALMSGLVGFLVFVLFCTLKRGWGWHNFIREANIGIGPKFPETLRGYMTHVLPFAILFIFVMGYYQFFRVG